MTAQGAQDVEMVKEKDLESREHQLARGPWLRGTLQPSGATVVSIELSEDGPEVFLTVSALQPNPVPASSHADAAALAILCTEVRGGEVSPLRVTFAHPRSACVQRLQRAFTARSPSERRTRA